MLLRKCSRGLRDVSRGSPFQRRPSEPRRMKLSRQLWMRVHGSSAARYAASGSGPTASKSVSGSLQSSNCFHELSLTFLRCLSLHLKRFSHAFLLKNKTCERFRRFEIFHPFLDSTEQSLSGSRCGHRAQKLSSHSPQFHDRNCVTFELLQSEFRIRIS